MTRYQLLHPAGGRFGSGDPDFDLEESTASTQHRWSAARTAIGVSLGVLIGLAADAAMSETSTVALLARCLGWDIF